MLMAGARRTLTTEKASVIRDALSLVLSGVKYEGDVAPGTSASLEAFAKNGCQRMVLDLRAADQPSVGAASGVRNLRASHIGQVLVVTAEVSDPGILHEIEALRRPHPLPAHIASGLLAFVHMVFCALRR
jgi:DNA-binding response OmpR family regulator